MRGQSRAHPGLHGGRGRAGRQAGGQAGGRARNTGQGQKVKATDWRRLTAVPGRARGRPEGAGRQGGLSSGMARMGAPYFKPRSYSPEDSVTIRSTINLGRERGGEPSFLFHSGQPAAERCRSRCRTCRWFCFFLLEPCFMRRGLDPRVQPPSRALHRILTAVIGRVGPRPVPAPRVGQDPRAGSLDPLSNSLIVMWQSPSPAGPAPSLTMHSCLKAS